MQSDIILTLQITMIGMGLVFGAIILLWCIIALLMRVTGQHKTSAQQTEDLRPYSYEDVELKEQKRRAALAAVAVALAINKQEPHKFPLPPTALVSAWQAVMRASNIRNRGSAL